LGLPPNGGGEATCGGGKLRPQKKSGVRAEQAREQIKLHEVEGEVRIKTRERLNLGKQT